MKNKDWNNYCMRKFGASIRRNILEAYLPFSKAVLLKKEEETRILNRMMNVAEQVNKKDQEG